MNLTTDRIIILTSFAICIYKYKNNHLSDICDIWVTLRVRTCHTNAHRLEYKKLASETCAMLLPASCFRPMDPPGHYRIQRCKCQVEHTTIYKNEIEFIFSGKRQFRGYDAVLKWNTEILVQIFYIFWYLVKGVHWNPCTISKLGYNEGEHMLFFILF